MNKIKFKNNVFGLVDEYVIHNKKEGVEIESSKKYFDKANVLNSFFSWIIDIDEWKHSWHMTVSNYRYDIKTKSKINEIIQGKIDGRKKEIEELEFALKLLKRKA